MLSSIHRWSNPSSFADNDANVGEREATDYEDLNWLFIRRYKALRA
jgi:hypothetical protein